jgi:hypothetical protein
LLEPQGVSGSFIKRVEEATHDKYGEPLVYSSWEAIRGPQVEFPVSNPTVTIEQNVPSLQLDLCTGMMDTLNSLTLWGLPARTWSLTQFDWERKYHGLCYPYYTRRFVFEANYRWITDPFTGAMVLKPAWDRVVDDYSNFVLHGRWGTGQDTSETVGTATETTGWIVEPFDSGGLFMPDPANPGDFDRFQDRNGNLGAVMLNGMGTPYYPGDASRSFYWVYISGLTPNVHQGTYASAQALSINDSTVTGVGDVYGPFYTNDQAVAAAADSALFTSARYRGWSGPDGFPKPGRIKIERWEVSNFLLLGIPTVL